MNIKIAEKSDVEILLRYDEHIRKEELESIVSLGRVIIAEDKGKFVGWLRWNLFWDNTPFMNMLFLLEEYRNCGFGKAMVSHWENLMKADGYGLVMTSSLSNEAAQYFYRKLDYVDAGALLLPGEPLEILFIKKICIVCLQK